MMVWVSLVGEAEAVLGSYSFRAELFFQSIASQSLKAFLLAEGITCVRYSLFNGVRRSAAFSPP